MDQPMFSGAVAERDRSVVPKTNGAARHGVGEWDRDSVFSYFRVALKPGEAEYHWQRVLENHRKLLQIGGARVDIRTTAFDYFLQEGFLTEPVVVEQGVFAETELLAYRDGLTGLNNYAYFENEMRMEVARSLRYQTSVCLILVDLDEFKKVNDEHGHAAGNDVLQEVGRLLLRDLRTSDVVARFGGDEFAILLHRGDLMTGVRVAARKKEAIRERFRLREGHQGASEVTASFGVCALPSHATSARELFEVADRALYHSKGRGGDRFSFPFRGELVSFRGGEAEAVEKRGESRHPPSTSPLKSPADPSDEYLRRPI